MDSDSSAGLEYRKIDIKGGTMERSRGSRRIGFLLLAAFSFVISPASPARSAPSANCGNTSTGFTPLIDMGSSLYHGFPGGLYPGGSNLRPSAHEQAGLAIAGSIGPLDTLGNPDPARGRIVLASIGMSNATMEFQAFIPKVNADPARNPKLLAVDCAVGGQAANIIRNPNAAYWDSVAARLRRAGSSPAQAQAIWLKEANASPTGGFPASAETLQSNLGAVLRIVKQKLLNVRLAYISSRIYAGYASTSLNPEPYAYESGFAVKWLIQSQIVGDSLNFDPTKGTVEAPWLSWGPYLWADGLTPRSDGLVWPCSDFSSDGTHPSTEGRNLVADSLLSFFKRDETSAPWFTATVTGVAPTATSRPDGGPLRVFPLPVSRAFTVLPRASGPVTLDLFASSGRLVRTFRLERADAPTSLEIGDLPSGIYYLRERGAAAGPAKVVVAR
jgi:hypothetical protein